MTLYVKPTSAIIIHDYHIQNLVFIMVIQDPFVQIKIEGVKQKTDVHRHGGTTPSWNNLLKFKTDGNKIQVRLKSKDLFIDNLVGEADVDL